MDKKRWTRIELLFTEALELGTEERAAFLEKACADDPSICAEVEALLSASQEDKALAIEGRLLNNVSPVAVEAHLQEGEWDFFSTRTGRAHLCSMHQVTMTRLNPEVLVLYNLLSIQNKLGIE